MNIAVQPPRKPFAFSYSRMKNFEVCPRRHHEVDLKKSVKEAESEQLTWGNAVHKALELRIRDGVKLPIGMEMYEGMCQKIAASPGKILTEQQLAINKDFGPTAWFAPNAWFRAKIDVAIVFEPVALLCDFKTGKIVEDSVQLALAAAAAFAHIPKLEKIRSRFYWLGDNVETDLDFKRESMPAFWTGLWPRIEQMKVAYDTQNYPPIPGRYCRRWCPVKSCEYHGK